MLRPGVYDIVSMGTMTDVIGWHLLYMPDPLKKILGSIFQRKT